jgi:hypothetical protein
LNSLNLKKMKTSSSTMLLYNNRDKYGGNNNKDQINKVSTKVTTIILPILSNHP